jgi:hypothetical protein
MDDSFLKATLRPTLMTPIHFFYETAIFSLHAAGQQ